MKCKLVTGGSGLMRGDSLEIGGKLYTVGKIKNSKVRVYHGGSLRHRLHLLWQAIRGY